MGRGARNLTPCHVVSQQSLTSLPITFTGMSHMQAVPSMSSYGVSKTGTARLVSWLSQEVPDIRAHHYHPG